MTDLVIDQTPFGTGGFADNPEPRCPCVLLLDTSGSMRGAPIAELNAGLMEFKNQLGQDDLALKRVEVAVVGFGPIRVHTEFTEAQYFMPPTLEASGDTPMGAAIVKALEMVRARKDEYRANGISFYRPWVFLITDGAPTDDWKTAAAQVREGEASRSFSFFAVGIESADLSILKQIAVREPLKLRGLAFRELFVWLSNSMKAVSQSTLGSKVSIPKPGWDEV